VYIKAPLYQQSHWTIQISRDAINGGCCWESCCFSESLCREVDILYHQTTAFQQDCTIIPALGVALSLGIELVFVNSLDKPQIPLLQL